MKEATLQELFSKNRKADVGVLAADIAGEGERIIYSDGDSITWNPPPVRPVMPDWSEIKSIKRYFFRSGHQVWPAWVYHPTEEPRLLKDQDQALELGICFRKATPDETARYGLKDVWDWEDDCEWRPKPYPKDVRFNPHNPGQGKTYIPAPPNPIDAQRDLAKAIKEAFQTGQMPPTLASQVNPELWGEFQQFMSWKESQKAPKGEPDATPAKEEASQNALSAVVDETAEREIWEAEAVQRGIRVDGRWSLKRLREEVEKAASV